VVASNTRPEEEHAQQAFGAIGPIGDDCSQWRQIDWNLSLGAIRHSTRSGAGNSPQAVKEQQGRAAQPRAATDALHEGVERGE